MFEAWINQQQLIEFMTRYAYEPWLIYGLVIGLLAISSFGLPMPEEVTLVSAAILAYFGQHPDRYPPPFPGAEPVDPWVLAGVCFFAVYLSDHLVFEIGRFARRHSSRSVRLRRLLSTDGFKQAEALFARHGAWVAGAFRFAPGLRFPGHFSCGFLGLPRWKFFAVDGAAALLSVPTQVLLIAFYGEQILAVFKQFKIAILVLIGTAILGYAVWRVYRWRSQQRVAPPS
jgi:membrane protein DedA with SNARE-associated domain